MSILSHSVSPQCHHQERSHPLKPFDKQAADVRLTAKVASMSTEERNARVIELRNAPKSFENSLEWAKLMFGEDMGLDDVGD